MEFSWERLRPKQMEQRMAEFPVAYIPFGSLEWHGNHNPLGLDAIKAHALCQQAAKQKGIAVPPTYWPIGGMGHPWTVRMSEDLIKSLMISIFEQLSQVGFKVIMAITGHYGFEQLLSIKRAALNLMDCAGTLIYAGPEYEFAIPEGYKGDHAAKWETSLCMYLFPELVDMKHAEPNDTPMDGVHGEDPRIYASSELGEQTAKVIILRMRKLAEKLYKNTTPREAMYFREACGLQLNLLTKFFGKPLGINEYWLGVTELANGDFQQAISQFWICQKILKESN